MEPNANASIDPSSDPSGQTLDLNVLEQLLSLDEGESGLLKEMFGLFQDDMPGKIQAIEATLGSGELSDMADLAHSVKGAAGTMGVPKLRDVAAELEGSGRKGSFANDPGLLLERLKNTYAEARAALQSFITSRDSLSGAAQD